MKLFLATFTIDEYRYMRDRIRHPEKEMRIIWAEDAEQAEQKLRNTVESKGNPGDDRMYVENLDITEAIS